MNSVGANHHIAINSAAIVEDDSTILDEDQTFVEMYAVISVVCKQLSQKSSTMHSLFAEINIVDELSRIWTFSLGTQRPLCQSAGP